MNKQIKNLMGQTLDEKFSGTWSTMDMQDLAKFSERFAELIVKETMQVVANQLPSNQYLDVADAVIKHFGVEE